jgi:hypothetical protein
MDRAAFDATQADAVETLGWLIRRCNTTQDLYKYLLI